MTINTVKELDALYAIEQDLIATRRKQDYYKTEEEDAAAQRASWENYLAEKYRITQAIIDKKAIVNYYGGKLIGSYSRARDDYYAKKIDLAKYKEQETGMINVYESKLISAGVLDKQSDTKVWQKLIDDLEAKETLVKESLTPVNSAEFETLCKQQMPVAISYIKGFV